MSSGPSGDVYGETLSVFEQRDDSTEPLTTPEVADGLDAAQGTVSKRLEQLVRRGELETKDVGANARVWWRPYPDSDSSVFDQRCSTVTDDSSQQNRRFRSG